MFSLIRIHLVKLKRNELILIIYHLCHRLNFCRFNRNNKKKLQENYRKKESSPGEKRVVQLEFYSVQWQDS